jgi:hypothetical protein
VSDLGGFAAANDLVGKSGVEVREAIGVRWSVAIYRTQVTAVRAIRGKPEGEMEFLVFEMQFS